MLISIVVLSYNRPVQVERILKNFVGVTANDFNIIIKDDVSPLRFEIEEIVDRYSKQLNVEVLFHSNESNMGYDGNLISSFSITDSEYVFLLSDDDYLLGSEMESIVRTIKNSRSDFYFTPYIENGEVKRVPSGNYVSDKFSNIIYNSILFSGLVYRVGAVNSLVLDYEFLSKCIYSQVYLALALIYKNKSYGVLPSSALYLGGDGDNFFGKNESAVNSDLLSDRKKVTSDLLYQQFLLKVVDKISTDFDPNILISFKKEYSIRLVSYGLRVRGKGYKAYFSFLKTYFGSVDRHFILPTLLFLVFFIFPSKVSRNIYNIGVKRLRKSG
ncbi:glycosyltransferase family 2 protein [Salinispirillum marinum]|uniref:Glycosyltransferase family 2 protein n=2 Tax=Saccharospirillaceae TaxID=255527 RepID=A0ABV8BH07_9GAMM